MEQAPGQVRWEDYPQRLAQQELSYQDEGLTLSFNGQSRMDLPQYVRSVENSYLSQSSAQSQELTATNWGRWPAWNKYEPGLRSSMSNTPLGPPTPGPTSFDETRTINPDSLIKPEPEFGNPWSFTSSNTPQELILPISPTSPSRGTYHTPHSQYESVPNGYFDLRPAPPQSIHSHSSTMISSSGIEDSASTRRSSSGEYYGAPGLQLQPQESTMPEESTEAAKKRSSKSENQSQSKRSRSKALTTNKHNQIEKRYRTNLNDKITALRDSVPSLRAMMDPDHESGGEESDEESKAAAADKRRRSIAKAEVLSKATEYIHDLEKTLAQMERENKALQAKVESSAVPKSRKRNKRDVVSHDGYSAL